MAKPRSGLSRKLLASTCDRSICYGAIPVSSALHSTRRRWANCAMHIHPAIATSKSRLWTLLSLEVWHREHVSE